MGDILHALPAVTALRLAHPTWQIGWVVDPRWQALLKAEIRDQRTDISEQGTEISAVRDSAMPVVDRLHFASTRAWKRRPLTVKTAAEINALRLELRAAKYDAVVDLQGAIRSAAIVRLAGCPRRIGEAKPREWPAQWLFTERVRTRGAHVIEQDVELASAVAGDTLAAAEPMLPVDPEAESWCDKWLAALFAGEARPIALIAPGAGWGAKRWPPERYAEVAQGTEAARIPCAGERRPRRRAPGRNHHGWRRGGSSHHDAAAVDRAHAPHRALHRRRHRPAAPCLRAGPAGGGHLRTHRSQPQRTLGTRAKVLRSPGSRRDHKRRTAPDPGLLTIAPEDVLHAADELLAEGRA